MKRTLIGAVLLTQILLSVSAAEQSALGAEVQRALRCRNCVQAPLSLVGSELESIVGRDALARQFQALTEMGNVSVAYRADGVPVEIRGDLRLILDNSIVQRQAGDDVTNLLQLIGDALLAAGGETLTIERIDRAHSRRHMVTARQSIDGLPVFYGSVNVVFDPMTRMVMEVSGNFLPNRNLPKRPLLEERDAAKRVLAEFKPVVGARAGEDPTIDGVATLGFGIEPGAGSMRNAPRLMWAVPFTAADDMGVRIAFVDAVSGTIVMVDHRDKNVTTRIMQL